MAIHHFLARPGESLVTGFGQHVGLGVGMVAGVQIRAAYAAPLDLEHELPLTGFGVGKFDDIEPRVLADDGPHLGSRLASKGGSGLM